MLRPPSRVFEDISYSADGMNQRGLTILIDFATQSINVNINHVRGRVDTLLKRNPEYRTGLPALPLVRKDSPHAAYEAQAHKIARRQVLLAGYRLANLVNENLK